MTKKNQKSIRQIHPKDDRPLAVADKNQKLDELNITNGRGLFIGRWKLDIGSFKRRQAGFTLIELLIVIAIIGVLTTLLMTNFVGVRQRARDAQRKADLRQIQAALQLYHTDNGRYHIEQSTYRVNSSACPSSGQFSYGGVTYMSKVPCDPLGSGTGSYNSGNYYYYSSSDGATYTLAACLENANDNDVNSQTTAPSPSASGTCSGKYYVLTNP